MPITIEEKNLLRILTRCLNKLEDARETFCGEGFNHRLRSMDELIGQVRLIVSLAKMQANPEPKTGSAHDNRVEESNA